MDLSVIADEAEREADEEGSKLREMQSRSTSAEPALFEERASQRRLWLAKSELALKVYHPRHVHQALESGRVKK